MGHLIRPSINQFFTGLHAKKKSALRLDSNNPDYLHYLGFYGLDFRQDMPGLVTELSVFEVDGERLVAQVFKRPQSNGAAIIVHGYYDHIGLYRHLIRYCLDNNLDVYAFDLPGHGLSTGARASIDSFDKYQHALDKFIALYCPSLLTPSSKNFCLLGQSMGGGIVMQHLLSKGYTQANCPYKKVVLFAPLVRPRGWKINKWVFVLLRGFIREQKRRFSRNSHDVDFLKFVRSDPLQAQTLPTQWVSAMVSWMQRLENLADSDLELLLVQGTSDATVDWKYNLQVIKKKFRAKIVHIDGARHHLVNESAALRKKILNFMSSS